MKAARERSRRHERAANRRVGGHAEPPSEPFSLRARARSLRCAAAGFGYLIATQHNAWLHALATLAVISLGIALDVSRGEWCWLVLAIASVWTAEAFNTALETLADAVSADPHPLVGRAKDLAATAVLVSALAACAIGLFVFGPYFWVVVEVSLDTPQFASAMLPLAGFLLAAGVVAGFIAGLIGVGGGIVLVPVLFHVFVRAGVGLDVAMHLALGTSLAAIIFTAWRSMRAHRALGAVDEAVLKSWIAPVLVGVFLGSALAGILEGFVLTAVYAVVAFGIALYMAFGRESWKLSERPPVGWSNRLLGAALGFLSVLMGLGGGTLGVPALTLCGVPIRRAVGTAAGLGVLIAIPGTLWFALAGQGTPGRPPLSLGYVNVVGVCVIVPATVLMVPLGARLAHRLPRIVLRRAFAVFLMVASVCMLLSLD